MNRTYKPYEFAKRAGVTVRALHHYDRLGLLKPSGRTDAGYRVYSDRDFVRLEQIVALKFIGFPLSQIRDLLHRKNLDLAAMLRQQREIIDAKRRHLDRAVRAIEMAEKAVAAGRKNDWEPFRKIIEVIQMETRKEWMKKYFTEEQLAGLRKRISPEMKEESDRGGPRWLETRKRPLHAAKGPAARQEGNWRSDGKNCMSNSLAETRG